MGLLTMGIFESIPGVLEEKGVPKGARTAREHKIAIDTTHSVKMGGIISSPEELQDGESVSPNGTQAPGSGRPR